MRRPAPDGRHHAAVLPYGHEYHARLATAFAVLGIRTTGNRLSEIVYLPQAALLVSAVLVSRQINAIR